MRYGLVAFHTLVFWDNSQNSAVDWKCGNDEEVEEAEIPVTSWQSDEVMLKDAAANSDM